MSAEMKCNDEEQKENERIHRLLKIFNSLATRIPVISLRRADDEFTILRTCTRVRLNKSDSTIMAGVKWTQRGKLYVCNICRNELLSSSFRNHYALHTGEKSYQCEFCKMRFANPGSSFHHKKKCEYVSAKEGNAVTIELNRKSQQKYRCCKCNKLYSSGSALNRHMREMCTGLALKYTASIINDCKDAIAGILIGHDCFAYNSKILNIRCSVLYDSDAIMIANHLRHCANKKHTIKQEEKLCN